MQQQDDQKRSGKKGNKSTVGSLAKGFHVLEAFRPGQLEMTLSEVSQATNLDSGTVFRLLNTLVDLGYLEKNAETRQFRLSLKVVDLGLNAIGRSDVRDLVLPILRKLVSETGETANFGILQGADILYLERVRAGMTRLGVDIRVGTTIPAFCSAIGQALLAFLPQDELELALRQQPNPGGMPALDVPAEEVHRSLEVIRRDGYALKDSYFNSDLRVLAVPVLDRDSYPLGAISVVAPSVRTTEERMRSIALGPVRSAADDVFRAFSASGSVSSAVQ